MTINYTEKGIGLHDRIVRLGHWLVMGPNGWECDDEAAVQAIIDGYSMADAAAEVQSRINDYAASLRIAAVIGTSSAEMSSWTIKRDEAAKYSASGNAADAPMLSVEASARNITLDALVQKVQNNSSRLSTLEAQIAGVSGKHRDAVGALSSFAEIAAYDWSAGWPAV